MESQLDKLIVDFAQALRKLAGKTQSIVVSIEITDPNRLSWTAAIQENEEDQSTYSKSRSLPK